MAIEKPYFRICRPFPTGDYVTSIASTYLRDPRYAADAIDLIRGYHLLEKCLYKIFDYVEPCDANKECFSHEIYALFLRAATEFEANARAILAANSYGKSGNLNILDYVKLNGAMRLSEYAVTVPIWSGSNRRLVPFQEWKNGHSLTWYQSYNDVKHDRSGNFPKSSLVNTINAVASVFCILFAQFNVFAFDPNHPVSSYSIDDGGNHWSHDAGLLTIEAPVSWPFEEMYDFDWCTLKNDSNAFSKYSFNN